MIGIEIINPKTKQGDGNLLLEILDKCLEKGAGLPFAEIAEK